MMKEKKKKEQNRLKRARRRLTLLLKSREGKRGVRRDQKKGKTNVGGSPEIEKTQGGGQSQRAKKGV